MGYHVQNKKYSLFVGAARSLGRIPHIHTHLEMVYMKEGEADAVLDNQVFPMKAGDLFLAFPNQIHSYNAKGPVQILISIFSPGLHRDLEKYLTGRLPVCPVLKKSALPEDTERQLISILKLRSSESETASLCATGSFLVLMSRILPLFSYQEDTEDYDSMRRILSYCAEHFTENLSLDSVSGDLYLNKYYISHLFRQRMKFSFNEFIGFLRVNHACELLQKGESITQAALTSGFSSIRTFNRVFLKVMKVTPREYLHKNEAKENSVEKGGAAAENRAFFP